MQNGQLWRSKRIRRRGAVIAALAIAGLVLGGMALGAAGKPSMQVLPSPRGLKYSQTVRVKAQNLPKGSGTIALTICGLNTAKGAKIANVTADDCAGQNDLSSGLVKLQQWKDGTFDQQYKLPKSGQKFAKNQRFCDAKHYCALVVADANPDKPAYHVDTKIYFTDQQGSTTTTKPRTATTKPKPKPTTTTTRPTVSFSAGGNASAGPSGGSGSGHASVAVNAPKITTPPTTPPTVPKVAVPAPVADAVTQACGQVADAIKQGGGDASALTVACSTLVNGGGGAQLGALLQSPSFACVAVASAAQDNAQLADACSQLATALQPYSSQLGDALSPALALLP
ncbi:MAG: hypothetical protein QOI44_1935 [Actinomycetota bacterium]|jgi:hypothetical protein|nr:hypothetical protein [Actinomycetota bacterium]